jgi:hypothetical protein
VTSRVDKGLISELQNQNWRVLSVGKLILELKSQVLFMLFLAGHFILGFCTRYVAIAVLHNGTFVLGSSWVLMGTDTLQWSR